MKKFIIPILVMVVAIVVAVVSCKKDNETQKSETLTNALAKTDDMNEYLISFKAKLLSAQKGEEFVDFEQARRDLNNLLNFDFGDANYATNVFQYDTLHTKVVISEGQVDLSQLAVTYKDACELIKKAYEQVNLPEKSVYTIYCTFDQEARNGEMVDVQLVLTTRGLNLESKGMCWISPLKSSIDQTDCWYVWGDRGHCDGTDVGYDHVDILQLVYNNNISVMTCVYGNLYYTDQGYASFEAISYPEPGTTHCRLWTGNAIELNSGTVSSETMSYYYQNMRDIISDEIELLNDDDYWVTSITCTIIPDTTAILLPLYTFSCKYYYGKPHCTGSGPDD